MIGMPVGPPRLPNAPMAPAELAEMERDLRAIGFFEHIAR
jgi:hypothetical protein